jgi:HSP20 family protein
MRQPQWNPWLEMERLNTEMSRLFQDLRAPSEFEYPPINVWTSEKSARVTALLPGYDRDKIDVSIAGSTLTLKGEIAAASEKADGESYHRREREHAGRKFARTVELPFAIEADRVEASFKDGVLEVELPRSTAELPKKIAVQS